MPKDKQFEDILREKLYDYELEPPMHLWPAVAARRKRRHGRWWLFALGAGAALSAAIWWFAFRQMAPALPDEGELPVIVPAAPASPVAQVVQPSAASPLTSSDSQAPVLAKAESGKQKSSGPFASASSVRPSPERSENATSGKRGEARSSEKEAGRALLTARALPPATLAKLPLPQKAWPHNDCPDKFGKRLRVGLFADAWVGPWIGFGALAPRTPDPQLATWAEARRQTERPRVGYAAGLGLTLRTNRHVALRTGIDWTELRTRFHFERENVERVIIVTRYDDQGNVVGVDTTIETGTLVRQTTNRIRMVSVPVLLGWHQTHKAWSWAVYGGVVWNVGLWASGDLLSPELEPVSLMGADAQGAEVFRRQAGLGAMLNASLRWTPTHGLTLFAEPGLRRWGRSFTVDTYPLTHRFTEVGLRLGLQWQL